MISPHKLVNYFKALLVYRNQISDILEVNTTKVNKLYQELNSSDFLRELRSQTGKSGSVLDSGMLNPMRAPALYVICRLVKPDVVVETGVANGFSSSFILNALEINGRGDLYSIDLPNQPGQEIEEEVGWLIPDNLKHRWHLTIGSSQQELPLLLQNLKKVDIFFHDSDHSYDHMMMEFTAVWKYLQPGSYLLADDITDNDAFRDFAEEKNTAWCTFFKTGVARIP